jgi:RHS repeat-associated protein
MNHSGRQSMLPNRETLLCRYHYDPLDRLVDCTPSAQTITRRFYLKDRLAAEIQGAVQRSIMQHDDLLLAQQQRQSGGVETHMLATDQQRSVLNVLDATRFNSLAYSPYGHHPAESGLLSLLGFNGERPDPVTGCYLLGNGYRAFNPVLMRFNSPDSWSPFGEGGLNGYAYCNGDPLNLADASGHLGGWALIRHNLPKIVSSTNTPKIGNHLATKIPTISRKLSESAIDIFSENSLSPLPPNTSFIGYHGSTNNSAPSLLAGISPIHMDTASGLSSGKGFYVSPTRQTAIDFSEAAASYIPNSAPQIFEVHVRNFESMRPGVDYRFATMGEGGLKHRTIGEMEILLRQPIYKAISIRVLGKRQKLVLPKASEAPF